MPMILPEFRILRLTLQRKSASKYRIRQILIFFFLLFSDYVRTVNQYKSYFMFLRGGWKWFVGIQYYMFYDFNFKSPWFG